MNPRLSEKDKLIEAEIRELSELLYSSGYAVRREQLSRGRSYRVKSGDCLFSGSNVLFVDKRLPVAQQLSVLVDYVVDFKLPVPKSTLDALSNSTKGLLLGRISTPCV